LTCTVNKAALESYDDQHGDPGVGQGIGANVPVISFGQDWEQAGLEPEIRTNGFQSPPFVFNSAIKAFDPATGAMTIAIGNDASHPLGKVGTSTTLKLLTLRYRVKALTAAATSTVSCAGSFLDPDGKPVVMPSFVMPPALNILPGYTISGNVS